MKIGLVYEGGSDFTLLSELFRNWKDANGDVVEVTRIQPIYDATIGRAENGGWTEIRKWCRKYSNTEESISKDAIGLKKSSLYWKSLIPFSKFDSIMIQIDTDIADYICGLPKVLEDFHGNRKKFVRYAILQWLNEDSLIDSECYTLLTSQSLETWILAITVRTNTVFSDLSQTFDFEDIENPESKLISLGYAVGKSGNLIKSENYYTQYANDILKNYNKVKSEIKTLREVNRFLTTN